MIGTGEGGELAACIQILQPVYSHGAAEATQLCMLLASGQAAQRSMLKKNGIETLHWDDNFYQG